MGHAAKPIRVLVCVGDIHSGSTVSLLRPGFKTLEGQQVEPNDAQRWLWQQWQQAWKWFDGVVKGDAWALVLMGDLVEGVHHKTKQVISPEVGDHIGAALELLEPIAAKAARVFVVNGTEVHVGNHEHSIGKTLKAVPDPDTKRHAWERLDLSVAGCRCIFQHHVSTTSREWLRSSGLGIALANEQLAAARSGEPLPKVLVSAHRHVHDLCESDAGTVVVTHPWQLHTRYTYKVAPSSRTLPGLVALDWRGSAPGTAPRVCRWSATLRPPPTLPI